MGLTNPESYLKSATPEIIEGAIHELLLLCYGYLERDDTKRQVFLEQLALITAENVVYADESGMDNRTGRETRPVMSMLMDGINLVNGSMRSSQEDDKEELI